MRTTVRLDDALLRAAKEHAARTGTTLTLVLEDALREMLARRQRRQDQPEVQLPTFRGDGVLPGVDLDDSSSLIELMDTSPAAD